MDQIITQEQTDQQQVTVEPETDTFYAVVYVPQAYDLAPYVLGDLYQSPEEAKREITRLFGLTKLQDKRTLILPIEVPKWL